MPFPPLVEPVAQLSTPERARTVRHASLHQLGEVGQRRLRAAHVGVIGVGGLGSPVILALAAAGVGELTVVDDDVVEHSNLQRQVVHRHGDLGALKVASAVRTAADLSPETLVHTVTEHLTAGNAVDLLRGVDLVIDGSDSFATRAPVAAACEQLGIPLVWGTLQGFDAQVTVFWSRPPAGEPIVLADLYPPHTVGEVPTCAQVGVLGSMAMQVGSMLATEAIKLITGIGDPLFGRVLVIDSLGARQREVPLRPSTRRMPSDGAAAPGRAVPVHAVSGRTAPVHAVSTPAAPSTPPLVFADELAAALDAGTAPALLDIREDFEVIHGVIPGATHIPMAHVLAAPERIAGPVVVVCAGGVRARTVAHALHAVGVEASVLEGGMHAWTSAVVEPAR